jgi:hypothetical protein
VTQPAEVAVLVLQQVSAVLGKLTAEQLAELAGGRAELVFRAGDTVVTPGRPKKAPAARTTLDLDGTVAAIRGLAARDQVEAYLREHDRVLTVPVLKELAQRLGPTVSGTGKTKAQIKRNIVEGTAGFRERSAAMSGGAWN